MFNLVLFLITFSAIIVSTQWYLGKRALKWINNLEINGVRKNLFKGILIACLVYLNFPLFYTFAAGVPKTPMPSSIMYSVVYPYAIWGSSYVLMFILLKIMDIVSFSYRKISELAGEKTVEASSHETAAASSRRRFLSVAGKGIIAAPVALSCYGVFIGKHNYITRDVAIHIPGLPIEIQRLKIVQISDIHCGIFMNEEEIRKWVNIIANIKPDVLMVTGDFVGSSNDSVAACAEGLKYLRSLSPIYACLGNHDYYGGEENITGSLERSGVKTLRNSSDTITINGGEINICGVEDLMRSKPDIEMATQSIEKGKITILMAHNPNYFDVAKKKNINLTLSGHTHGGQININMPGINFSPARLITNYVRGHYRKEDSNLYVNPGVGTIGFPLRLNVPPEITVFKLV